MSRQHLSAGGKPWDADGASQGQGAMPTRPKLPARSRSGSPMLSAIGLAQPTLHLALTEELLYLHPAPEGAPTEDPWVSGNVTLWLPKPRNLRHLTVRLLGKMDIGWPDNRPYETTTSLDKEVRLFEHDKDVLLPKGEHTFSFQIIVPSTTATYERCPFGRVRHTVVAKAKGLGSMGGDIVSNEKTLFLIVNLKAFPCQPGGAGASSPPPPLHHKIEGMVDEVGPYTLSLQSQNIMIGGLLLLRFNLISPPTDVEIYGVKVKINQHFHLRSAVDPKHTFSPPVDIRTVAVIDSAHPANYGIVDGPAPVRSGSHTPHLAPIAVVPRGEGFRLHHLARIPNDNLLRPTTQPGTETGIVVEHSIAVEVTYRNLSDDDDPKAGKGKEHARERRKLVVSKPLDIFSCCCFLDSLTLPVYAILDPHPEPDIWSPPCVCGMKLGEVIKRQADTLLREDGEDGITYAPLYKDDSGSTTPTRPGGPTRGRSGGVMRAPYLRTDSADGLEGTSG